MHYEVIESKLNHMSLEELEIHDPNTFGVVINKLLHISFKPNKAQETAINTLAYSIANIEIKGKTKHSISKNIYYDKMAKNWFCSVNINGKYKKIKTSKDKSKVEDALKDYLELNNLVQ